MFLSPFWRKISLFHTKSRLEPSNKLKQTKTLIRQLEGLSERKQKLEGLKNGKTNTTPWPRKITFGMHFVFFCKGFTEASLGALLLFLILLLKLSKHLKGIWREHVCSVLFPCPWVSLYTYNLLGKSSKGSQGSQGRQKKPHCPHTGDQVPFQLHNSNSLSSLVWRSEVLAEGGPSRRGK